MTLVEYLEFLNDPAVQLRIATAGAPILYPRDTSRGGSYVPRGPTGEYQVPWYYDERTPVMSITYHDAVAFAEWRTERARAAGEAWVFTVPSREQLDASRLAHADRSWVAGASFRPHWVKSLHAAPGTRMEPVPRYPVDETPHGVFDLTGSQIEWTTSWHEESTARRDLIGGSWAHSDPMLFQSAHTTSSVESQTFGSYGFRLVARPAVRD